MDSFNSLKTNSGNSEDGVDVEAIDKNQEKDTTPDNIKRDRGNKALNSMSEQGSDSEENRESSELPPREEIQKAIEDAKKRAEFKKLVTGIVAGAALVAITAALAWNSIFPPKNDTALGRDTGNIETSSVSGEQDNGVSYDYSHYLDRDNKVSRNAYDYSIADAYGDREATTSAIMEVADRTPEALSSYAYAILNNEEKKDLGLEGMNMVQIDDAISNDENGGVLQKKISDKLSGILNDKENTQLYFYRENDFEDTSYIYFTGGSEGDATPSEMRLAYSRAKRRNAPQVDVMRKAVTKGGDIIWYKAADLNMECGGQINESIEKSFPGVPEINEEPNAPNITTNNSDPTTSTSASKTTMTTGSTPNTTSTTNQTSTTTKQPKDPGNLSRIDEQINSDIANDVGTDRINISTTPSVKSEDVTPALAPEAYTTRATTTQNIDSRETVTTTNQANNYSENRGPANPTSPNAVQENQEAQSAADNRGDKTVVGGSELNDVLADLGIY